MKIHWGETLWRARCAEFVCDVLEKNGTILYADRSLERFTAMTLSDVRDYVEREKGGTLTEAP